jgi:hypothetical protein
MESFAILARTTVEICPASQAFPDQQP